jgi:hypothetical protein
VIGGSGAGGFSLGGFSLGGFSLGGRESIQSVMPAVRETGNARARNGAGGGEQTRRHREPRDATREATRLGRVRGAGGSGEKAGLSRALGLSSADLAGSFFSTDQRIAKIVKGREDC